MAKNGREAAAARTPRGSNHRDQHRRHAARCVTSLSRDLESRLRKGLIEDQGFDSLRTSLGPLFFLVWHRPAPITVLAAQLGVSKQACSQLATVAERAGYLERVPSPDDRRAKSIHLTRSGRDLVQKTIDIVRQTDADYQAIVGPRRYAKFTRTIAALYQALDASDGHALPAIDQVTRTVGALPLIIRRAQETLMKATANYGHAQLKLSHGHVLPFVGPEGARIPALARVQGIRREAVAGAARDLVSLGYLRKKPDPRDRRGSILFLAGPGKKLVSDALVELSSLEARIDRAVGRPLVSSFIQTAAAIEAELGLTPAAAAAWDPAETGERTERGGEPNAFQECATRSALLGGASPETLRGLAQQLHRELGDRQATQLSALLQREVAETRRLP